MPSYSDPMKKKYADMTKSEADFVRLNAEQEAEKLAIRHRNQPFFLKIVANKLLAEANRLEGELPSKAPESDYFA